MLKKKNFFIEIQKIMTLQFSRHVLDIFSQLLCVPLKDLTRHILDDSQISHPSLNSHYFAKQRFYFLTVLEVFFLEDFFTFLRFAPLCIAAFRISSTFPMASESLLLANYFNLSRRFSFLILAFSLRKRFLYSFTRSENSLNRIN